MTDITATITARDMDTAIPAFGSIDADIYLGTTLVSAVTVHAHEDGTLYCDTQSEWATDEAALREALGHDYRDIVAAAVAHATKPQQYEAYNSDTQGKHGDRTWSVIKDDGTDDGHLVGDHMTKADAEHVAGLLNVYASAK
jgi:hypothetical protein